MIIYTGYNKLGEYFDKGIHISLIPVIPILLFISLAESCNNPKNELL